MLNIEQHFLMVSMDIVPVGFSVQAWINIDRPHPMDLIHYPHLYTYMGEWCTWFIYSCCELTPKIIAMLGEQADRICISGEKKAKTQKLANR